MNIRKRLVIFVASTVCFALPAVGAPALSLVTEEYAPYAWRGPIGHVRGISVDIVTALLLRAKIGAAPAQILPWARGMAITQRTANTCLFSTARTQEREDSFKWIGPIARLEWVLFARTEDKIVLNNLQQARRYTIGTYVSNATVEMLRSQGLKVELTSHDRINPRKLKLRRIDLWAVGQRPGLHLLRELHLDGIEQVFSLADTDLYLACHPSIPDTQVSSLNGIIREMYRDGTMQKIYSQHGYRAPAFE
jgi:polar amino acid transport system substrate-binding protein